MDRKKTDYVKKGNRSAVTSTGTRLRVLDGNDSLLEIERRVKKRRIRITVTFLVFVLILGAAVSWVLEHYHVESVYVEGNMHYSSEEIIRMVTDQPLGDNSLFLSLKYRDKGIEGIPFIQSMEVKVLAPDTVKIVVYEKTIAGFVEYLDGFMYFDRDGIVVEAAEARTLGIPEITGISFDHVVLYEPLPVENPSIFQDILDMTQMLSKYEIIADQIYFDSTNQMTLYFGEVRAKLGSDENIEEKMARLKQILPAAEGKKGVFRLENYSGSGENVSFEQD